MVDGVEDPGRIVADLARGLPDRRGETAMTEMTRVPEPGRSARDDGTAREGKQ